METNNESLIYPIGRYKHPEIFNHEVLENCIEDYGKMPALLITATENLTKEQLDTPYRAGGWTIRQVVHHLADSHANGYIRMKLALTEDVPTVKPYDENLWAALPDSCEMEINAPLMMLAGLHIKWIYVMQHLQLEDWSRTYFHPQYIKHVKIEEIITLYAWHGMHHLGQITTLIKNEQW